MNGDIWRDDDVDDKQIKGILFFFVNIIINIGGYFYATVYKAHLSKRTIYKFISVVFFFFLCNCWILWGSVLTQYYWWTVVLRIYKQKRCQVLERIGWKKIKCKWKTSRAIAEKTGVCFVRDHIVVRITKKKISSPANLVN